MHLKSLTLKGFKSFASATTLRFEPGITCVVGPNGSGKSNVLDALTWVMGEKGAKALRGATMQDVIFAGTSGRPPLGRAEVTLTIDNSDGALPIEYTEVSITRRMFREGATEYEINGDACRLLDIQELLSDSGIGREMHVIVGQGQLSSILESKPEERRGFIEEAAGVLKHRKRKEKALRKLDAMQANLTRLTDLTSELRRQLKPLGKQAEIARRAQTVQAELRDARLRLVADDLVTARAELARDEQDEAAVRDRRSEVERMLQDAQAEQTQLEEQLAADVPRLTRAQDTWYQLSALDERLRGTVRLAQERLRHLSAASGDQRPGRDPEELEAEAERTSELEEQLREEVVEARTRMAETELVRSDLEAEVKAAERAHLAAVRAVSDRREGLARLSGRVDALRGKVGDTTEELGRLSDALEEAVERAELAAAEYAEHESSEDVAALDQRELTDRAAEAAEARQRARDRVAELVSQERAAEREVASWQARVEALSLGLRRKDGAGALLAAADRVPGLLGSVASLLTVDSGAEVALAAALGPVADAVAMAGREEALEALRLLKAEDAGRAGLLLADGPRAEPPPRPALPAGASWAADRVRAPEPLRPALEHALRDVVVVADLPTARAVLDALPGLTAVTAEGDVLGANWASGGSERDQSVIEVQAALDEARREREAAVERADQATSALAEAREAEQAARDQVRASQEAVNEARVHRARGGERLNRLRQAASSAQAEVSRLTAQRDKTDQARRDALRDLEELERRLSSARDEPDAEEPDTEERDAAARRLAEAREVELDARLALRTAEERARSVQGKADQLRRAARAEREA
uniref:chromosome segregation protein SMC n=1 Tax=Actinoalloteichus spitiensis TaxID=252394 RepID=UPI000365BA83